jgi:hypothetical protein
MRFGVALLFLGGCGLFGGGQNTRHGTTETVAPSSPARLEITLVSHCARPVELCHGSPPSCVTLANQAQLVLKAQTGGTGEVFISLKDAPNGVFLDTTFATLEVDESCTHIHRSLTHHVDNPARGYWKTD